MGNHLIFSVKNGLLKNKTFISETNRHEKIIKEVQSYKRPLTPTNPPTKQIDTFFNLIVFKYIYDLDKTFLKTLNGEQIDYNKIKSFIV